MFGFFQKTFFILALTAAAASAQRSTTMLPGTVKNFELPNFDENTGAKEWELFGEEAEYKSDTRIDVMRLKLNLLDSDGKLKATITSPLANVNPVKKFVSGDGDIFVVAPEYKIEGKKWAWDSPKKFVEVFDSIVVDIIPEKRADGDGEKISDTRITGGYGSMLNAGRSNIFDVRKNVRLSNDQMTLECDALRADAPKQRKGGSGVSEIDASGSVKMKYADKNIRAGTAKVYPDKSTAFLSGSPSITDIPSRAEISGDTIELDKGKKTLLSKSGKSTRATAVIFNTSADGKSEKITISADSIKMGEKGGAGGKKTQNFFDFAGNVKVVADSFTASCDSLAATADAGENGKPQIEIIKGTGHIKLSNSNGTATSDNMEIIPAKSEVVLYDNAVLTDPERGMRLFAHAIVFLKERNTGIALSKAGENPFVVLKIREGVAADENLNTGAETVVKSRRLKFVKNEENMRFDFERDVKIDSGDIDASCQKMQVLAIRGEGGGDGIRKITASDNVKIAQKGYSAESEIAVIYPKLKGKSADAKRAAHRYVELSVSPDNPAKRPTIYLPATKAIGLDELSSKNKPEQKPTVITSDKQWLVGGEKSDKYFFEGDVKAVGTDMDVSCKRAQVGIRTLKNGKRSIAKIDLFDDVELTSGMKNATAGKMEIFPEDEMVVLSEDPVVIDKEDNTRVSGARMVYNRGKRAIRVEAEQPAGKSAAPEKREKAFIPDFEDDETLEAAPEPKRPTIKILPRRR